MNFAIVDIETTGQSQRMTEIAIIRYRNGEKLDEYSTLINPQQYLPTFITHLTGITPQMLENAPTLEEVAEEIYERLQGNIFVAHSVNFDYPIVKKELKRVGFEISGKKLCTVRLSRKMFEKCNSYSLGNLCAAQGIKITNRHRALGDARATGKLWEKMFAFPEFEKLIDQHLHARSQEGILPPHLPKEEFLRLPDEPGIYYFLNTQLKIIYVGKAKNIKKRIISHFYDKSKSKIELCREVAHLDFELSGSELLALLMEDAAIKKYFPKYNTASKRRVRGFGITTYKNRKGIINLGYLPLKQLREPIFTFDDEWRARNFVEKLCKEFNLCPKHCQLMNGENCKDFYLMNECDLCNKNEPVKSYNDRVKAALSKCLEKQISKIIKQKGRKEGEEAFVFIEKGKYLGYGFCDENMTIKLEDNLKEIMIKQKHNAEIEAILRKYLIS